jgi:hypothetical protein
MKKRNVHSPIMAHVKKSAREGRGTKVLVMGNRLVPAAEGYTIDEHGAVRRMEVDHGR